MKTKRPDRADVARSLLDLEKLFGKRPPEKEIAARGCGEVVQNSELQNQHITTPGKAQGGAS